MLSWIAEYKFFMILIIFIDGVVMMHLGSKHRKHGGGVEPGVGYFWGLMKQGEPDGIAATVLTGLAALCGLLLASTLLLPA